MSHDESVRAKAVRLARAGMPQHEIAAKLDVARSTVCRWLRKAPDLGAELVPDEPPPAPSAPAEGLADAPPMAGAAAQGTPEEIMRRVLGMLERDVATAQAVGDTRAATRLAVELAKISNNLARVAEQAEDVEAVKLTPGEIDAAMKAVTDRFAVLERVPLTCRKCGRDMRVRIASDGTASE
jgi:hypothetical protein